jgi:hypothetical protein
MSGVAACPVFHWSDLIRIGSLACTPPGIFYEFRPQNQVHRDTLWCVSHDIQYFSTMTPSGNTVYRYYVLHSCTYNNRRSLSLSIARPHNGIFVQFGGWSERPFQRHTGYHVTSSSILLGLLFIKVVNASFGLIVSKIKIF